MADGTRLNAMSGGDLIKTEDVGPYKLAVGKIYLGAEDVDGGPVTAANPLPVSATIAGTSSVTGLVTLSGTSATSLLGGSLTGALPTGANTIGAVNVGSIPALNVNSIGGVGISLGSTVSAHAVPVTIATDQGAVPVSVSGTSTSSIAALTDGTQKTRVLDASGINSLVISASGAASTDLTHVGGGGIALGATTAAHALPIAFPNDQAASISGTVSAAPIRGSLTDRSGTITTGGTAQQLAASNASRSYLLIVNPATNAASLWVNFTTTAVAASPSIEIRPGGVFTMEGRFLSTEAVSVIGATTSMPFTAKEG